MRLFLLILSLSALCCMGGCDLLRKMSALCCCMGGCDLLRKMAGRPTSEDILAKKELILREQEEHRLRLDSVETVRKKLSDSLAVLDSMRLMQDSVVESRDLADASRLSLTSRYYVVIGAFGKASNAERFAAQAESRGYPASLIRYRNGFTAVGICPSDSISEAYRSMMQVRDSGLCPDAWILDNRP